MMRENDAESVIITGASRGIGREIAYAFARETDHPLVLIARSHDDLHNSRDECLRLGASAATVISCDLTDQKAVQQLTLPESVPPPGVLINNAGSYLLKPLAETTYNEFINQIHVNLFAAVHLTSRLLPVLKKRNNSLIINICSEAALKGMDDSGAYSSSKHALLGYTRSLREELIETSVAVTAINLGQTQSTSWLGSDVDPEKLIDPADIGQLLVSLSRLSARTVAEEITLAPQHGRVPPM